MKPVHHDQHGVCRGRGGDHTGCARRCLRSLGRAVCVWALAAATVSAGQEQAPPRFQASVDLASVDVNVVDGRGQPMTDLVPGDFVVRVDGQPRKVISAEWVSLAGDAKAAPVTPVPEGYSTNEAVSGGRLIVIAVDQPNIRPNRMLSIIAAASAFVDKLSPADRVAVASFGLGGAGTPFISDRARLKRVLAQMTGQKNTNVFAGTYTIALSEALAITHQEGNALERVIVRECFQARSPDAIALCQQQVKMDAFQIAGDATHASDQTARGLGDLFTTLKAVAGPKTLVLISEGFLTDDTALSVGELGALAAASRTSLYTIQIDDTGESDGRLRPVVYDRIDQGGMEALAQNARGANFRVVGTSNTTFDRIQTEISGYYLLAVESDPRDRDGKSHPIRVDVSRNGAVVRARRQMLSAAGDETPTTPRQAVGAGLNSPLLMSALPLRVGTFALQGPEQGKVQLLIHADIGNDYSASKAVSVGFSIFDATGRTVEGQFRESRLSPLMVGVPSSLEFAGGASLPPGDYTLKLAAAEGDRVGSVEHPIHAALVDAGNVTLSALMLGGPSSTAEMLTPTVGYTVSFGVLHGYVEAYGPQVEAVTVKYEVATDEKADALMQKDVSGVLAGDDRMIFTGMIPVDKLPPGKYVLRARVSSAAKPVKTLTRAFEVAPPAVLMTSAEGVGLAATETELFLPVDEAVLAQPFRRNETLTTEALTPFLGLVAPNAKPYFDAGVQALAAGDYPKAETSLKRAISPDADSTAPLVYLAATFAAAGHDVEAASAWQTALSDGAEIPQIYDWLSEALLRTRSLLEARATLEEATAKWPADPRFTRPLAMIYALFGKGRDAVRVLERYLETRHDDPEAYRMGVDWIYHAHAAGGVVHSRVEDLRLAHAYADAYAVAKGPQLPLVQQWIAYLDNQQR